MVPTKFQARVDRVLALRSAASAACAQRDYADAIGKLLEIEQMLHALIADEPQETAHLRALGSTLYECGEVHLERGDAASAVRALQRAEAAYLRLRESGSSEEAGFLLADVRMRRARALAIRGHAASALADAQGAVVFHLGASSRCQSDSQALDLARIMAWNAWVTARVGDPDLAVASADTSIRLYQANAARINADATLQALHVPTFTLAAKIAVAVHGFFGRSHIAASAARMASSAPGLLTPNFGIPSEDALASALTLGEALDRAGAGDLRAKLVRPATDCAIRVPIERTTAQAAAATAIALTQLSITVLEDEPRAAIRIGLEAHAIFAAPVMPRRFDAVGPHWVAVLHVMGRAGQRLGRDPLAEDCSNWLVGAIEQLIPLAPGLAAAERAAVQGALDWQEEVLIAHGQPSGAASVRNLRRRFDAS